MVVLVQLLRCLCTSAARLTAAPRPLALLPLQVGGAVQLVA